MFGKAKVKSQKMNKTLDALWSILNALREAEGMTIENFWVYPPGGLYASDNYGTIEIKVKVEE